MLSGRGLAAAARARPCSAAGSRPFRVPVPGGGPLRRVRRPCSRSGARPCGRYQVVSGISLTTRMTRGCRRRRVGQRALEIVGRRAPGPCAGSPRRTGSESPSSVGRRRRPRARPRRRRPSASWIGPEGTTPSRSGSAPARGRSARSRRRRRGGRGRRSRSQASPGSKTPRRTPSPVLADRVAADAGEQHSRPRAWRRRSAKPSRPSIRRPAIGVVGGDPDLGAAGERPALAAGLLAGQVDEHGVALGRGVELEHPRRGEALAAPASRGRRGIPEPMKSRTGWCCSPGSAAPRRSRRASSRCRRRPSPRSGAPRPRSSPARTSEATASRAPPAIAPPTLISSAEGW